MNDRPTIAGIFETLASGRPLSGAQADFVMEELLQGRLDAPKIVSLLSHIESRGAQVDELVGAARAMRRHVTPVPLNPHLRSRVIDTCGTGGAPKLFNVSTLAAIAAAGAGAKVVKHGNRSRTGRGSAEILIALGVNVDVPPSVQARCVESAGICYCFAIHHHPAMRHASEARKLIGTPTIFNLLGPLTNPGGASRQLLGVARREHVLIVAEALRALGCVRAMVVHSLEGYDELSTTGQNLIAHVEGGRVWTETIDPAAFGLPRSSPNNLEASALDEAARIARSILSGEPGPRTDMVILNAAAALIVSGEAGDWAGGIVAARRSLQSGAAARVLKVLIETARQPA